jgi:hypothetical protein
VGVLTSERHKEYNDYKDPKGGVVPNPFKPSAGATPPLLVGREHELDIFAEGLDDGPGSPGLLTRITGQRGTGKTVLLTAAENVAKQRGWVVISETATAGLLDRLGPALQRHLDELGTGPAGRRISAVNVAGWGVGTELPPREVYSLRDTVTALTTLLQSHGTGLLITIDEIHAINRDHLLELAAIVQHQIREELPIAMMVAGIPQAVEDLLNENVATFLRRADSIKLGSVPIAAVQEAFATTFKETQVPITEDQLIRAATATRGYPFLIQLVGYHIWRLMRGGPVTDEVVERGIAVARARLGTTVLEPALTGLSAVDKTFLLKMAEDDGPSKVSEIAQRMGRAVSYTSVYRQRLLDAGMIAASSHGRVDFFVPELRDYLREHIASFIDIN